MGRRNVLQSSTYPDATGTWWKADLNEKDILWVRRNLVPDQDGLCKLERASGFVRSTSAPSRAWIIPEDWAERVHFREGEKHPWALVQMGGSYQLGNVSEQAKLERDPELAPHINFRKLTHGNTAVSMGFLKEFGPLFRDDMTP